MAGLGQVPPLPTAVRGLTTDQKQSVSKPFSANHNHSQLVACCSSGSPDYGRPEAYDANGNLLNMFRSDPLGENQRQTLTINRGTDEIAYLIAFPDNDYLNSSPFGAFDRLRFSVPEALAVAGQRS